MVTTIDEVFASYQKSLDAMLKVVRAKRDLLDTVADRLEALLAEPVEHFNPVVAPINIDYVKKLLDL